MAPNDGSYLEAVKALWDHLPLKAKTSAVVETRNHYHFAAWYGRKEIHELIYNDGWVLGTDAKDISGSASIHLAIAHHAADFIEALVGHERMTQRTNTPEGKTLTQWRRMGVDIRP